MAKEQESSKVSANTEVMSKGTASGGYHVLQEVVQMTGLPGEYLNSEISEFLGTTNGTVNEMTLDQLRAALLNYLEVVNEEMTRDHAPN